jgi:hypothetical protein
LRGLLRIPAGISNLYTKHYPKSLRVLLRLEDNLLNVLVRPTRVTGEIEEGSDPHIRVDRVFTPAPSPHIASEHGESRHNEERRE